jgi:hypothetical protein
VTRLALTVELDADLGQFRQADLEVGFAVGIVGGPALPSGFAPVAGVDAAAEREAVAERVLVGSRSGARRKPNPPNPN